MPENLLPALIGVIGTVCTSLITAIVGPLVVAYLQRSRRAGSIERAGSAGLPEPGIAIRGAMEKFGAGAGLSEAQEPGFEVRALAPENPSIPILAIASLGLGVMNLCSWLLPICGLPISILGLTFGIASINSSKRGLAIAGIVLCIVGLMAGTANAAIGAYMGYFGQQQVIR